MDQLKSGRGKSIRGVTIYGKYSILNLSNLSKIPMKVLEAVYWGPRTPSESAPEYLPDQWCNIYMLARLGMYKPSQHSL